MINDRLIAALGEIDDEMIIDAAPGRQYGQTGFAGQSVSVYQSERVQRRRTIYRFAALAACVCVVVAVLAIVKPWSTGRNDPVPNTGNNETVDPDTNKVVYPAMPDYSACKGSESVEADKALAIIGEYPDQPEDISGPSAGGPEISFCPEEVIPGEGFIAASDVPEKLAVYRHEDADPAGFPKGLDKSQMMELIDMYAERLGIIIDSVSEFVDKDETNKDRLVWLETHAGDIMIRARADGHVLIQIPEGNIPEDMNAILCYEDLVIDKEWGYQGEDHNDDGVQDDHVYKVKGCSFYDTTDPLKQAWMWEPVEGVAALHIDDYGLITEKVDDYPVISPARALEKLKAGEYSAPHKNDYSLFAGEEYIVGLRIEYYLYPVMEYIVPFYVYTVMLPDMDAERIDSDYGIKGAVAYAEYYIPAIDERYFESPAMTWN